MLFCENNTQCLPVIDMEATGRNIERLRHAAGLTVKQLQHVFGFTTPQAIYKWQNGLSLPTLDNMIVLARVLGVSVEHIIVCREPTDKGGEDHGSDIAAIE